MAISSGSGMRGASEAFRIWINLTPSALTQWRGYAVARPESVLPTSLASALTRSSPLACLSTAISTT